MKILFAGLIDKPSLTGWQRMRALVRLGHEIVPVSLARTHRENSWDSIKKRALRATRYEWTLNDKALAASAEVLRTTLDQRPDLIWLEWPRLITAETITEIKRRLPQSRVVSFQHDNPFADRTYAAFGWKRFFEAIPYYDLHLVKRTADLQEYRARGAKRVELFTDGYCEELLYPEPATSASATYQVVFVGTALDYRVGVLDRLTRRFKLDIHIFGERWNRTKLYWMRRDLLHPPAEGDVYRRIICGSEIALGFVSHSNQDDWTIRTFEVPACGAFFLTERTKAHQEFYEEGKEAEFFASPEECRDKILYYLAHDSARARIAAAGRQRCLRSGYGLRARIQQALKQIASTE
jgi:spore maturation protein CgeB